MGEERTQNAKVLLVKTATANAGGLPTEFRCRHCDLNTLKQRNYYIIFILLNALILLFNPLLPKVKLCYIKTFYIFSL